MAKSEAIPGLPELAKYKTAEKALPVYFFCGTDTYAIDTEVKELIKSFEKLVLSEFDKETITSEKKDSIESLVDLAYSFPFGGGKKIIIVDEFKNFSNPKDLKKYIDNPCETTILIIKGPEKVNTLSEPYKTLAVKGYIFQANSLKGLQLASWLKNKADKAGIKISQESAALLVEITGEEKSLLEIQLIKLNDYVGDGNEITAESIRNFASATKEYSIFDLQDALSAGNKTQSLKIIDNLISKGTEISMIISMLSKFILTITRAKELQKSNLSDDQAASKLSVARYYYIKCKTSKYFNRFERLQTAVQALLSADLKLKTSAMNPKLIAGLLIAEIFNDN